MGLTNQQRIELLEYHKCNPKLSQKELGRWAKDKFHLLKPLSQTTVSDTLKLAAKLAASDDTVNLQGKRSRPVQLPTIETALTNCVLQCEHSNLRLNGDLIIAQAQRMVELMNESSLSGKRPKFAHRWLQKFQLRHNFKSFKAYGESGSVDMHIVGKAIIKLKAITSEYQSKNIFNMDETGLFYSMPPDRTIASKQISGIKGDKARITIALTTNCDGSEYIEPFFIGHANKPRCFQKKTGAELGFQYRSNKKAWMTTLIFQDWLKSFNNNMASQNRKVLLLLDNAPSHIVGDNSYSHELRCCRLKPHPNFSQWTLV